MSPISPSTALEALRAATFPQLAPAPPGLTLSVATKRLASGRTLFAQGGRTPALFAVLAGEVQARFTAVDGAVSVLEHVQPIQLFGLGAFATGLPSRYEAVATRPTQLLVIGPAAYVALMDGWPGFARALLHNFAQRFDNNLHLLESARHRSASERLALALAQLQRERSEPDPLAVEPGAWRLRATQAELAQLAGVTRQTANGWLRGAGVGVGYGWLRGTQAPGR